MISRKRVNKEQARYALLDAIDKTDRSSESDGNVLLSKHQWKIGRGRVPLSIAVSIIFMQKFRKIFNFCIYFIFAFDHYLIWWEADGVTVWTKIDSMLL